MARTHSGRRRQPSSQPPTSCQASIGLGFNTGSGFGKPNAIGNFSFTPGTSKMSSEERFPAASSGRLPSGSIPPNMQQYSRPTQMARSTSQGGPGSSVCSGRTWSRLGEKHNDPSRLAPVVVSMAMDLSSVLLAPVTVLGVRLWGPSLLSNCLRIVGRLPASQRKAQPLDADPPEVVDCKLKGLGNKLTMEKFDSISDQMISGDNKSDQAANENKGGGGEGDEEVALYSDNHYATQKAKQQGLGLNNFIGELFELQNLTERIMHECVKKLLGNAENPGEEDSELESLFKLLSTIGAILETNKVRAHMDVYSSREEPEHQFSHAIHASGCHRTSRTKVGYA